MHEEEVLVVMGKRSVTSRIQHFIAEHLTMKSLSVDVRTHLSPPKMNYWLLENFRGVRRGGGGVQVNPPFFKLIIFIAWFGMHV